MNDLEECESVGRIQWENWRFTMQSVGGIP